MVHGESSVCGYTTVGAALRTGQRQSEAMNTANVFEIGIALPGRSEVNLAATTTYRLQLCTALAQLST